MLLRSEKTALIDGLLNIATLGGLTLAVIMAPNALQVFDKPIQKYLKSLDAEKRERELQRTIRYMQRQGLLRGEYEHGLKITPKARKRLEKRNFNALSIPRPKKWDKKWRLIFYDIPEKKRMARNFLAQRLRLLGCQQLQRSVWIHPFPCEQEINTIAVAGGVDKFITYLEVDHITNKEALLERFQHLRIG